MTGQYIEEQAAMVLTEKDSGRTVETANGSVLTILLQENASTGYRWSVEASPGLQLVGDNPDQAAEAIGAEVRRKLEFRATRVGSHQLRLKKWRDWEGETSVR